MIRYTFRSTVQPQHTDEIVGSGPVTEWADDEQTARDQAVAFERDTFGMRRARASLELLDTYDPEGYTEPYPAGAYPGH